MPAERLKFGGLETDDDIRQALVSGLKVQQKEVQVEPRPTPKISCPASLFRPTVRAPVPILTVFDDGRIDGEVVRLREPKFTIGRTAGDLRFPIDGRISRRHVEITRQVVAGLHRWVVTDLQSTYGVFVPVSQTILASKAEILVGNGRYRFAAPWAGAGEGLIVVSSVLRKVRLIVSIPQCRIE